MYGNIKYVKNNDRFVAPFLLGALTGGVAVGLTNYQRPVYYTPYPVYTYPYYYYR